MVLLAARGAHRPGPDLNSLPTRRRLDPVSPYVEFIVAIMLPTAAVYLLIGMTRGFLWAGSRRWRGPAPEPEPLDRLATNLRRLRTELEDMETRSGVTAKNVRLQALRGAYTDA